MQTTVENIETKNIVHSNIQTSMKIIENHSCFEVGTKVLMNDGLIKNIEDINVGELVMGMDSTPRTVLELCRNKDVMYNIVFRNWESYTVNSGHILILKDRYGDIVEITVEQYIKKNDIWKRQYKLFKNSVEFKHQQTSIEPYIAGYTCENIKDEYIINSRENRLLYLAGILDYNLGKDGDKCIINGYELTNYIKIKKDNKDRILFLLRSLGFYAVSVYHPNLASIFFSGNLSIIPTKNSLQNTPQILESEFRLEKKSYDDYYGFTLNGDNKFLLASFDVVHS